MTYHSISIYIVLILAGVWLLVPAFDTRRLENIDHQYKNWVEGRGKIVHVERVGSSTSRTSGSGTQSSSPIYRIVFEYQYQGEEFSNIIQTNGAIKTVNNSGLIINEELLIYIDPDHPFEATTIPTKIGKSITYFTASGILIFLGCLGLIIKFIKRTND